LEEGEGRTRWRRRRRRRRIVLTSDWRFSVLPCASTLQRLSLQSVRDGLAL
jgi:hypothetical protein